MAGPMKRLCLRAGRHAPSQSLRSFSTTTPVRRADVISSESNPFITEFPQAQERQPKNETADKEYEQDDLSSLALSELDAHRELRDLIRTAAWEMPLLSSLHKPFVPPKRTEQPLQWRYTTYMGEQHPAASKVVVQFDPHDIPNLTHDQRQTLRKLAGTRYDHPRSRVRMGCESFGSQAENKRYLGDVIASLIAEAKNAETDDFKDVPLDMRHVKRKPRYKFPAAWLLTEERKKELDGARRMSLLEEGGKVERDEMVSGEAAIEAARQVKLKEVEEPVMAEARQSLPRGKMGRKEMGQTRGANR